MKDASLVASSGMNSKTSNGGRDEAGNIEKRKGIDRRATGGIFRRRKASRPEGYKAWPSTTIAAVPGVPALQKRNMPANDTLEEQAIKLLPSYLAATLPIYREPGRSAMPVLFRATSASIVKVGESSEPRRRIPITTNNADIITPECEDIPNLESEDMENQGRENIKKKVEK